MTRLPHTHEADGLEFLLDDDAYKDAIANLPRPVEPSDFTKRKPNPVNQTNEE